MKSKIQFILSIIIFGTIGLVVRYIDLSSSCFCHINLSQSDHIESEPLPII